MVGQERLERVLHFTFRNPALLEEALLHTSFVNENPGYPVPCNERLEFLGDAFLGFVVARKLHTLSADLSEGDMTQVRAALVRMSTLAKVARALPLGDYLILGKGEEKSGGRERASNLGRALEAIIGAAVLDGGVTRATPLVERLLRREWQKLLHKGIPPDYKSQFQSLVQGQGQGLPPPRYRVVEASGPAHSRVFRVEVRVGEQVYGEGEGNRKKDAEAAAARQAIVRFKRKARPQQA